MRYFIINFEYQDLSIHLEYGQVCMCYNHYVNRQEFIESIKKKYKVGYVIITNIIELSEKDWNQFLKKK